MVHCFESFLTEETLDFELIGVAFYRLKSGFFFTYCFLAVGAINYVGTTDPNYVFAWHNYPIYRRLDLWGALLGPRPKKALLLPTTVLMSSPVTFLKGANLVRSSFCTLGWAKTLRIKLRAAILLVP